VDTTTSVLPQIQGQYTAQNGALSISSSNFQMVTNQNVSTSTSSASCSMSYGGKVRVLNVQRNKSTVEVLHFDVSTAHGSSLTTGASTLCTVLQTQVLSQKSIEADLTERDNNHLKFVVAVNQSKITAQPDSGPYLNDWVKNGSSLDKTDEFLNKTVSYAERESKGQLSQSVFLSTDASTGLVTYKNPECQFEFELTVSKIFLAQGRQTLMARKVEEIPLAEPSPSPSPSSIPSQTCGATEAALKNSTSATGLQFKLYDHPAPSFRLDL
jgi:hypothetical protein